ncbi:MAG TPA: FAD-dependent oxidoreductase [Kofleriaceae bacterium]|nr:FAD-dependent oxidoreductase [Kofleriaceae bacterium]
MGDLPDRADVVIVGGGFAGAATAYELVRAGVTGVLLLEREPACGQHASGRNAALGRQLVEDERITDFTLPGAAFLRHPPDGFAPVPLWRQTGSLLLCDSAEQLAHLAGRAHQRDLPHQLCSMAEVVARWPRLAGVDSAGAVAFPTDGVIDVHALLEGYLAGARAGGLQVRTRCPVTGLADRGGRARVDTPLGAVDAGCVVVAAGAWAEQVGGLAGGRGQFTPMHRHLYLTEPVPGLDRAAPFVWNLGAAQMYARPEGTGYLLSACDEAEAAPGDAAVAADALPSLAGKLSRAAPGLAELGIARAWACLRTFAPDRRPVVDWDTEVPWLFWVAGLGGHGATASDALGAAAALKISERLG